MKVTYTQKKIKSFGKLMTKLCLESYTPTRHIEVKATLGHVIYEFV